MSDEKSPGFWFAEQSDGGRVGRQSFGWVRVHVDSTARLPIVVKGSGHDEIRSTEKKGSNSISINSSNKESTISSGAAHTDTTSRIRKVRVENKNNTQPQHQQQSPKTTRESLIKPSRSVSLLTPTFWLIRHDNRGATLFLSCCGCLISTVSTSTSLFTCHRWGLPWRLGSRNSKQIAGRWGRVERVIVSRSFLPCWRWRPARCR